MNTFGGRNLFGWLARALTALLLAGLLVVAPTHAQSTFGSLIGSVQDSTGAVLPGAIVHVKNLNDNSTRDTTADAAGEFQVLNLNPGTYAVTATSDGFAATTITNIALDARQQLRVDVKLQA